MKNLLLSVLALASLQTNAYKYCGSLSAISIETGDGWDVIRMSLYNKKNNPKSIVVHDGNAIEELIQLISGDESYELYKENYYYWYKENPKKDQFFVCVEGDEPVDYRGSLYMKKVDTFKVWQDFKELN